MVLNKYKTKNNKTKKESDGNNLSIQLRLSLVDMAYKQFFGRTWSGPFRKLNKSETDLLNYAEIVYLSTPIVDDHVLIVIEIVGKTKSDTLKSLGWTAVRVLSAASDLSTKK